MNNFFSKKSVLLTFALFCGFLLTSPMASAAGKIATCQIDENGKTIYKGKCTFTPQGGGSFYLSGSNLSKNIGLEGLMVWIEDKNVAVVQGPKFHGGLKLGDKQYVLASKKLVGWVKVIASKYVHGSYNTFVNTEYNII